MKTTHRRREVAEAAGVNYEELTLNRSQVADTLGREYLNARDRFEGSTDPFTIISEGQIMALIRRVADSIGIDPDEVWEHALGVEY